ncbi:hypothetical protein [Rossellomorea aquimaris]|uniref:hypothetical protein n=1 Tax=Rossellomorea aquimaris TaxID=189382 RepID=UPI0007D0585D|nr:hypothetical protein [Rossellomorea aquimaris]
MRKDRHQYVLVFFLFILLFTAIITNPSKDDYIQFSEESIGQPNPAGLEIERINFYFFSAYTPVFFDEYGVSYLGLFGKFIRISDGQFDYPWWLEFFN